MSKKHQPLPVAAAATNTEEDGLTVLAKFRKKRASKANTEKVPGPINVKELALERQAPSSCIAVDSEPHSDIEKLKFYYLGPPMTAYKAFPLSCQLCH